MQLFEDFELVNDNDNDHVNVCHFILKKVSQVNLLM